MNALSAVGSRPDRPDYPAPSPPPQGPVSSERIRQLPEGAYLKARINGAASGSSPAGQDMAGMVCVRRDKASYPGLHISVVGKWDMFRVIAEVKPEYVQKFHPCPEFERRRPGTDYRG